MLRRLTHVLAIAWWIGYVYFIVSEKNRRPDGRDPDGAAEYYREKNRALRDDIDGARRINVEMAAQAAALTRELAVLDSMDEPELPAPSEEYELSRRRIYSNAKDLWFYVVYELNELEQSIDGSATDFRKIKRMVGESFRSLLTDIGRLADVDRHSEWRQETSEKLSDSVQTRLERLQNPRDCDGARKLVCNYSTIDCGYVCRVHFRLNCLVAAYVTNRTLIVNGHGDGGWQSFFLPSSDSGCSGTAEAADGGGGATTSEWPGTRNTRVLTLDVSRFITPGNPNYPFEIPADLAPALKVLHGDPTVWWVGQFLKFILRPQPSTVEMLDEYAEKVKFQTPIVGIHIARHESYEPHELQEYMFHVDQFYKMKELSGGIDKRRIYLSTDEPTLFWEFRFEYPDYEVIGDEDISNTAFAQEQNTNRSIRYSIIDIHFLSRCDYLVCTLSSDVGRMAYEIMNSLHPDASARCTSLDGVYNYPGGEMSRLHVAVLPHQTNETDEIELRRGDLIVLTEKHWYGFSSGLNLRTTVRGRFPSFKVAPKMESKNSSEYPEDAG